MRSLLNMTLRSALLARQPMWSADLFTISLASGKVYRWTSADQPIGFSGHWWSASVWPFKLPNRAHPGSP